MLFCLGLTGLRSVWREATSNKSGESKNILSTYQVPGIVFVARENNYDESRSVPKPDSEQLLISNIPGTWCTRWYSIYPVVYMFMMYTRIDLVPRERMSWYYVKRISVCVLHVKPLCFTRRAEYLISTSSTPSVRVSTSKKKNAIAVLCTWYLVSATWYLLKNSAIAVYMLHTGTSWES